MYPFIEFLDKHFLRLISLFLWNSLGQEILQIVGIGYIKQMKLNQLNSTANYHFLWVSRMRYNFDISLNSFSFLVAWTFCSRFIANHWIQQRKWRSSPLKSLLTLKRLFGVWSIFVKSIPQILSLFLFWS